MARSKLKISPAIADRTLRRDGDSSEEGMEAVLSYNKERRRYHRESKRYDDDDVSAIFESPENTGLLDLVQKRNWEDLMYRVLKEPHTSFVKFTGRSTNSPSAGNLLLHEVCKKNPPIEVIDALMEANEKAVSTKGNAGYLPLHYACAHGASIELIRLLHSLHPDAARAEDDEEGILPLHLACMTGITKEDVFMCLLTSYPEASKIRDDFGRLPMDYAKSIRSDSHRKIAIECLKRAKWLEVAAKQSRDRTEIDFHQRIKGYEQAQANQLKLIEEVHTKELKELEATLESKDHELRETSQSLEDLDKHLQEMTDKFRERVDSSEKALKAKNRKLQGQLEKAKEETEKTKEILDMKAKEIASLSEKIDDTKIITDSLKRQLKERSDELDLALNDIETLNKHSEWLETVKDSIQKLAASESPMLKGNAKKESTSESPTLRDSLKKESSSQSVSGASKKLSSPRKSRGRDSASVTSRKSKSGKTKRSVSRRRRSRSTSLATRSKSAQETQETREPSFASQIIGSNRE